MINRLINHTGSPLGLNVDPRLTNVAIVPGPRLGQSCGRVGHYRDPILEVTYQSDGQTVAQLPSVQEGVCHVVPRDMALTSRALQLRGDVLTVEHGHLVSIEVMSDRERALEQLLLLQETRFRVMQDPNLTVRDALHAASGTNTVDVPTWHLLLEVTPLGHGSYLQGDPAPMEQFIGPQAVEALTAAIRLVRQNL